MDISGFISWFIVNFSMIIREIFSIFANIKFLNTSLLGYSLSLMVLGGVFNLLFSSVRNRAVREVSNLDRKKGKEESNDS